MKVVVVTLLNSISAIISVVIVMLIIWLMFAILGVNLFAGKFQYCSIDKYEHSNSEKCEIAGGKWKTFDHNFDNFIEAMLTLFVLASLEGWPDIMAQAMDATGEEEVYIYIYILIYI